MHYTIDGNFVNISVNNSVNILIIIKNLYP